MMTYTNTASEYRDGTRAAMPPGTVGLAGAADDVSERRNPLAAERAIDDALADSFPASDPPSWNAGVTRPEPVASWRFIDALISFAGAAGVALLVPFAILLVGLPAVLAIRGLIEAIGWLFGVVVS
jgi:hypothetical protein